MGSNEHVIDLDSIKSKVPRFVLIFTDPENAEADKDGKVRLGYDTIEVFLAFQKSDMFEYAKDKKGKWLFNKDGTRQIRPTFLKPGMTLKDEIAALGEFTHIGYSIFGIDATLLNKVGMTKLMYGFFMFVVKYKDAIENELAAIEQMAAKKKGSFSNTRKSGTRSA